MYKKLLTTLFLLMLAPALPASDYQVEIIIFEHLYHEADGEIAEIGLDIPDAGNAVELSEAAADETSGFKPLSSGFYKLGGVYNELKYTRDYRPILHMAWEQPALNQSRARYVHVRKEDSTAATGGYPDAQVKLEGLVRIRSTQFLHADIDMFYFVNPVPESFLYTAGAAGETLPPGGLRFAELKETRRMKLNELHYFDHPVFGLFLRVSRVKN